MTKDDLKEIHFERVHRIPTHASAGKNTKKKIQPRPIIAKVSFFKDKKFIKSHIKNLPKGEKYGVAHDFPNEVEEIRKTLCPLLKKSETRKEESLLQHRETSH